MICPNCGNAKIRLSEHPHWNDVFQRIVGRQPYRCRDCRHRFYAPKSSELVGVQQGRSRHTRPTIRLMSARNRKRIARRLIVIAIFAVMFAIFWLYLRYITTGRGPAQDSRAIQILSTQSSAQAT